MLSIFALCIAIGFPMGASAKEGTTEKLLPISAEMEHIKIDASTGKEKYSLKDITIRETEPDAFGKNSTISFVVKKEIALGADKYLPFADGIKGSLTTDTVCLEYASKNGDLIITIKDSNPTKLESFALSDLKIEKTTAGGIMGMYALYASTESHPEKTIMIPELLELQQYIPPREMKPLSIKIELGQNKMVVNHTEKMLRTPAYLSENGYTMLPVRDIGNAFTKISPVWYPEQKEIYVYYAGIDRTLTVGEIIMETYNRDTNKKQNVSLCNAVEIKNGRTFLALRDICHIYNIPDEDIHWNPNTRTVTIDTEIYA